MEFNFTKLIGKLSENEIVIVTSYVSRNDKDIIKELNGLNEVIVGIPILEIPAVNGSRVEDIVETFSLRREGEMIFVDLIK